MRTLGIAALAFVFAPALFAPSLLAGEEWSSGGFAALGRHSEKVFVGRVSGVEKLGLRKRVALYVAEGWKGVHEGEAVNLLVLDRVAHAGDPTLFSAGGEFLFYVRRAPAESMVAGWGELFIPASGDSSVIDLSGAEGAEIRRAARSALASPAATIASLELDLVSCSERVRASALAQLIGLPEPALRAQASRIVAFVQNEPDSKLGAIGLQALAKASAPETLDAIVDLALERTGHRELIPIAAFAANQIDAESAAALVATKGLAAQDVRAARGIAFLSRLDSASAIREVARIQRSSTPDARYRPAAPASALGGDAGFRDSLDFGSFEERKAAAYGILRWGNESDRAFLKARAAQAKDSKEKAFFEKLFRHPYLPLADL